MSSAHILAATRIHAQPRRTDMSISSNPIANPPRADQRLSSHYRFQDPNMDLFFVSALGWGPSGGLDVGEAFHVAAQIEDGDAASWVRAFANFGDQQRALAEAWQRRGRGREAGESRLKAFAS